MNPKILWLSDSPFLSTGYATISTNILYRLKNKFDSTYMSQTFIGNYPPPTLQQNWFPKLPFDVIGSSGAQNYCIEQITPTLRTIKPDIFGVLLDSFMIYQAGYMNIDFAPANSVLYFPSDGGMGMPKGCENILRKFNHCVAMSRFGQKQVKDYYNINVDYIPHACDTKVYHPVKDKVKNKREMVVYNIDGVGLTGLLHDKFVVGTVARNQGRKMLDRTVKSFHLFAQDKPNVLLLMHTDPVDASAIFDIKDLIRKLRLENKVVFTGLQFHNGFPLEKMNEIYNCMDVFALSTSGEGFGVPLIEAQACGVPIVATDYTTSDELVLQDGQSGELAKLVGVEEVSMFEVDSKLYDLAKINGSITGSWNVERGIVDCVDFSKKLDKLYSDPMLCDIYSKAGVKKVKRFYSWDVVIPQWEKYFMKMIE